MVGDDREGSQLLAVSFVFFSPFSTLSYTPLALSFHFSTPPHHSFKFDSGNVIHLYSFISLFLSPLPLFFNLPSVLSDYCGDGPVKASPITVFEQHCSLALCSADTRLCSICRLYCVCSALLRQNMYHTHATRLYRACIYWRPPKIYFEVIFFFFSQSWIIRLRVLKFLNDSEIDVFVSITIDIVVMSVHTV